MAEPKLEKSRKRLSVVNVDRVQDSPMEIPLNGGGPVAIVNFKTCHTVMIQAVPAVTIDETLLVEFGRCHSASHTVECPKGFEIASSTCGRAGVIIDGKDLGIWGDKLGIRIRSGNMA
ncbi:hypothetical protein FHL15_010809 [Xylaria flabelliformis]|uniref:Uncharacterized protein n=1 Tax=Xylaria flabelliformis TaxID=2512241 RepID=A0A553HK30_9PEZI|nr:hypothetical protein FHL15_010809 [Xylaria flabelliformis]